MNHLSPFHVRAEVLGIVGRGPPPELLLRVRGKHYRADRPSTFVHVRVTDPSGKLSPGQRSARPEQVLVALTVRSHFIEEIDRPERTLEVNGRAGSGRLPVAIRVVGHDTRIAGEVVKTLDRERFLLDAGIPILVEHPAPAGGLPRPGSYVEFLVRRLPEV